MTQTSKARRPGFSFADLLGTMVVLAILIPLVAQLYVWTLQERLRGEARQTAMECADNILEAARAVPWESLTPEWAGKQELPSELESYLPQGKLSVTIANEKATLRRVSAVV